MIGMAGCWPACHMVNHLPNEKEKENQGLFFHQLRITVGFPDKEDRTHQREFPAMSTVLRPLLPQERLKDILNIVKNIMFLS